MESVNLQISLPLSVYNRIFHLRNSNQINDIILDEINMKILNENVWSKELLKEGYILSKNDDKDIISDFEFSDLENWN
jgi:hypothetical protein